MELSRLTPEPRHIREQHSTGKSRHTLPSTGVSPALSRYTVTAVSGWALGLILF